MTFSAGVAIIGDRAFFFCNSLTGVTLPVGVAVIGDEAFSDCRSLTDMTIPESVVSIGKGTFASCGGLTNISVSAGNTAYKSVGGVLFNKAGRLLAAYPTGKAGAYSVPDGVTAIGDGAFTGCGGLIDVAFPTSVTGIGGRAFNNCGGLTDVTFPLGLVSIGSEAFAYCRGLTGVTIPASVTAVGVGAFGGAFSWCANLTDISVAEGNAAYCDIGGVLFDKSGTTLLQYPAGRSGAYSVPSGVTNIGSYAFMHCTMTGVTFPDSLTGIGLAAFGDCRNLETVALPDGLRSIGEWAFGSCHGLKDVRIPEGVIHIGSGAFSRCTSLTGISVAAANAGYKDVGGVLFNKTGTALLQYPAGRSGAYAIPSGVTAISEQAFAGCIDLTGVTIPKGVTSIGKETFSNCLSLEKVVLPKGMRSIDKWAFPGCDSLESVVFPKGLTSIGGWTFESYVRQRSLNAAKGKPIRRARGTDKKE